MVDIIIVTNIGQEVKDLANVQYYKNFKHKEKTTSLLVIEAVRSRLWKSGTTCQAGSMIYGRGIIRWYSSILRMSSGKHKTMTVAIRGRKRRILRWYS